MRHIAWGVVFVVASSGCAESVVESAIALTVERGDGVSTCVRVNLRGKDGTREVGKPEFRDGRVLIGLPQGDEGAEVTFLLAGGTGPTCQPTVPAEVASGTFAFPPGDVLRPTVRLERQSVDGGASSDGGSLPDGGVLPDGGTTPDGGVLPDGGTPPDGGGIVDADGDGSPQGVDCDDTDPRRTPGKPERCAGGIDDDCDTLTDCEDPSCLNQLCGRLDGGAECQGTQCVETNCQNGVDDNLDGGTDCADVSCAMKTCGSAPTGTCENLVCRQPMETVCDDNVSNDGDALVDCQDPDCAGRACSDGNACTDANVCVGTSCSSGTPVQCMSPPSACFMPMGACQSPGGCQYTPAIGMGCSDGFRCTVTDACLADGGCEGTPVVCAQSANPCRQATGRCVESDGGCLFDVLADGTACSTGNGCTSGEVCLAGTCQGGSTRTCTAGLCQVLLSDTCLGDGGCDVRPADAGAPCPGGFCTAAGACERFPYQPSNFDPALVVGDAGPLVIDCPTTFTIASAAITVTSSPCGVQAPTQRVITQDGGMDAILISASSLRIGDAGLLSFSGSSHPVIFAVLGDVDIAGALDVSASAVSLSGPGGNNEASCGRGGAGGTNQTNPRGGGGGGGFGTPGARGGAGHLMMLLGGDGGVESGAATLVPLRGGCAGGNGGGLMGPGAGGAAGGAVQISAVGLVRVRGRVSSAGLGGQGGNANAETVEGPGGGGGGSGGAILLEGQRVEVTGRLTANGGGGGSGEAGTGQGTTGASGSLTSSTAAAGATAPGGGGGNGGAGGARTPRPVVGSNGGVGNGGGGGGGGAVGRIHINSVVPCTGTPIANSVSPQPTSPHTGCQY